LHDVVGYFIIESVVVNTTTNFRPNAKVELLWDAALSNVNALISANLKECADPDLFLEIKLMVILFMQTLEAYSYPVTKLTDLMISLFDRYADLLKCACEVEILGIIEGDEYAPMMVNSKEELDEVYTMYQIEDKEEVGMHNQYPTQLTFSKGVPKTCARMKTFISQFYKFAEGFQQQNNEMDDLVKKSLENILSISVCTPLLDLLASNNLSQAVQILVNISAFEKACVGFESVLTGHRSCHMGVRVSLGYAGGIFRAGKGNCERKIFELVNVKIDEFLELADYDWMPTSVSAGESSYLNDLVDYIMSVIASALSNLPSALKQYIYFGAFDHLAGSLLNLLISPTVKKININFISNFDTDLSFLEKFADELRDVCIGDCFAELRQTVNFLKSENYEDYLNASIKGKKYDKVRAHNLAIVLEKLKHDAGMFGKSTAAEKIKKKSIEALLKALK